MADPKPPYSLGYGKPPKEHQFKPGKSGNPDGGWKKKRMKKKPKRKSAWEIMRDTLNETATVTLDGKRKKMPLLELMIRNVVREAAKGNLKALRELRELLKSADLQEVTEDKQKTGVLVVYAPIGEEEWEKATEGERLTKNPLEGLLGGDLASTPLPRGRVIPEFDESDSDDEAPSNPKKAPK